MTSLVDRYVHTALRRVPEQQRADIDRELRASIEDAVEARVGAGEEHLFNPAFRGFIADGTTDVKHWLTGSLIVVIVLNAGWDVFEVARKAERARR